MILTGVDQLWVAAGGGVVYLAVILDAYSRRVMGWHLSDGLVDSLMLTALRRALHGEWCDVDQCILPTAKCVCQRRLYGPVAGERYRHPHESQGEPLGPGRVGVVHANAEIRRGIPKPNIGI
jgi:hypothetical protein